MKAIIFLLSSVIYISSGSTLISKKGKSSEEFDPINTIQGKWVRIGPQGPMAIILKGDGSVDGDFGNDGSIDVVSKYELVGDIISFSDESGAMCQDAGQYKIIKNDYYIAFDLEKDNCGGRIKSTMGYWTRPEYKDFISELNSKLSESQEPGLLLTRARIYLAVGDATNAKSNLDKYIEQVDTNPRAYLNRACTNMPGNPKGVIEDCNKTIALEPDNKNAYFLRGLGRYELDQKEAACADFEKAIELGFSILRIAEQEKCQIFWENDH